MKKEIEIIPVDKYRRIIILKRWKDNEWYYFVIKQSKILFKWLSSSWGSGWGLDDLYVYAPGFKNKKEALSEAEKIKENFLKGTKSKK